MVGGGGGGTGEELVIQRVWNAQIRVLTWNLNLFAIRLIEMILGKFKFIQITIIGVAFMMYATHTHTHIYSMP